MNASENPQKAKQPCFTAGYTLLADGWTPKPEQRIGQTETCTSTWFSSSLQENKIGEPVFDFGPVFDAESFRGGGRRRTLLRRVLTTDPITRGHIFSTIIAPQSTCRKVLYDTE